MSDQSITFNPGGLPADDLARLTADMWADLAFDRDALTALKRDGLVLNGIHLGGPCPYQFQSHSDDRMSVHASGTRPDLLLDLWRMHFQRGLKLFHDAA